MQTAKRQPGYNFLSFGMLKRGECNKTTFLKGWYNSMTKRNKLFLVFSLLLCAALSITAFAQGETAPTATPTIP